MCNEVGSTLDIGKAENEACFFFKSNCIILRNYLSIDALNTLFSP